MEDPEEREIFSSPSHEQRKKKESIRHTIYRWTFELCTLGQHERRYALLTYQFSQINQKIYILVHSVYLVKTWQT